MALLPASVRCAEPRFRCPMPDALLGFPFWNLAPGVVAAGSTLSGFACWLLRRFVRSQTLSALAAAPDPLPNDFCPLRPPSRHAAPCSDSLSAAARVDMSAAWVAGTCIAAHRREEVRAVESKGDRVERCLRCALAVPEAGSLAAFAASHRGPPDGASSLPMQAVRSVRSSPPPLSNRRVAPRVRALGCSPASLSQTVVVACATLRFPTVSSPGLSRHSGGGSLPPALPVLDPMLQHCLTGVTLRSSASSPLSSSRCRVLSSVENPRRFRDALSDLLPAAEVFSDRSPVRCPAPGDSKSHAPACAGGVVGNPGVQRLPAVCRPKRRYAPRPFMGSLRPCLVFPSLPCDLCAPGPEALRAPDPPLHIRGSVRGFALRARPRGTPREAPDPPASLRASVASAPRSGGASCAPFSAPLRPPLRVAPAIAPLALPPRCLVSLLSQKMRSALRRGPRGSCRSHLCLRPALPLRVAPSRTRTNSRRCRCVARCRT